MICAKMIVFGKKVIVFGKVIVFSAEYDRFGIAGRQEPDRPEPDRPDYVLVLVLVRSHHEIKRYSNLNMGGEQKRF